MCINKAISYASIPQREETLPAVMSIKYTSNTREKLSMRVGGESQVRGTGAYKHSTVVGEDSGVRVKGPLPTQS